MRYRRAALGLALFCLSTLLHGRAARAGACPSPQIRVAPDPLVTAPTNVRVRLAFEAEEVTVYELRDPQTRQILKTGHVKASAVRVALRDPRGRAVPVTLRRAPAAHRPLLFVRPNALLQGNTRYAVVLLSGAEQYVISHLTTGAGPDTTPPSLGGVEEALFSSYPRARHWKDARGRYARVTLGASKGAAAYEVHELAGAAGPTHATLRAVVEGRGEGKVTLRLEESAPCHGANIRFPTLPKGARTHPLHLGIRALDDAGHQSALVRVTLDLAKPGRIVRPPSKRGTPR